VAALLFDSYIDRIVEGVLEAFNERRRTGTYDISRRSRGARAAARESSSPTEDISYFHWLGPGQRLNVRLEGASRDDAAWIETKMRALADRVGLALCSGTVREPDENNHIRILFTFSSTPSKYGKSELW